MSFYTNNDIICIPIPLKNNGVETATNIKVTITIPSGLVFNSINLPIGTWNGVDEWQISTLDSGISTQAILCVKVTDTMLLPATVTWIVTADNIDPNALNNQSEYVINGCKDIVKCASGSMRGYDTPTDAANDTSLPVGAMYYLTGNVPGTIKNMVMIKK